MLQSFYLNHFQVSGSVKLQLEAPADTVISEGPYRTKAFQIEGTKGKIIVEFCYWRNWCVQYSHCKTAQLVCVACKLKRRPKKITFSKHNLLNVFQKTNSKPERAWGTTECLINTWINVSTSKPGAFGKWWSECLYFVLISQWLCFSCNTWQHVYTWQEILDPKKT